MKTPKPILDRRRSIRVTEEMPFKIGHENYEIEAKTINVSEHGALCLVDKNIPLMTQLAAVLTVPADKKSKKWKTIRIKAVVVRREKDPSSGLYFLAIFFSSITSKDREILSQFIQSRLSIQG